MQDSLAQAATSIARLEAEIAILKRETDATDRDVIDRLEHILRQIRAELGGLHK